jgi:hypothetical protein
VVQELVVSSLDFHTFATVSVAQANQMIVPMPGVGSTIALRPGL